MIYIMEDKAEKHRLAVMKYREKLGIDKVREMTKEYTKKVRDNPEYKQKEAEKNKLRAKEKREQIKVVNLNNKIDAITLADHMLDKIFENTINDIPEKRGRGRPRLTEEQKAERLALRNANKKS